MTGNTRHGTSSDHGDPDKLEPDKEHHHRYRGPAHTSPPPQHPSTHTDPSEHAPHKRRKKRRLGSPTNKLRRNQDGPKRVRKLYPNSRDW